MKPRTLITLNNVDDAFEEERRANEGDRRTEERRSEDKPPSEVRTWILTTAVGVALTLAGVQFLDLRAAFKEHVVIEDARHEAYRAAMEDIRADLRDSKRADAWQKRILAAVAKKLGITVSEVQEPER